MWIIDRSAEKIARFDLSTATFTEYPRAAGADPQRIVLGADGALWFGEVLPSRIGRITISAELTGYPTASQPVGMAVTRNGIWFAGYNTACITYMTYGGEICAEYEVLRTTRTTAATYAKHAVNIWR